MTDIKKHYTELGEKCNAIHLETLDSTRLELLAKSHSSVFDFNLLFEAIKERPEYDILRIALREYQMGILSLNLGLYNQAFISLRFFFERTLVAIMFSSKEIELRLWQKGERDTYWNEIIDDDNGIFSHKFCRAFFPELKDESKHYKILAKKVYRECSEFVHGNLSVQDKIPENLQFSEDLLKEWHTKSNTIRRVIIFVFCIRYLRHLGPEALKSIEPTILEEFGTLAPVTSIYNM
ncbi:MAG: hypothetical protein ACKO96_05965 [Flammeovirgaceae bacterium]